MPVYLTEADLYLPAYSAKSAPGHAASIEKNQGRGNRPTGSLHHRRRDRRTAVGGFTVLSTKIFTFQTPPEIQRMYLPTCKNDRHVTFMPVILYLTQKTIRNPMDDAHPYTCIIDKQSIRSSIPFES